MEVESEFFEPYLDQNVSCDSLVMNWVLVIVHDNKEAGVGSNEAGLPSIKCFKCVD